MDDLISRAAAVAQIKENYCDWCDHTDLCPSCETRDCIATIEQHVPAVDAAPVVRCRDCKYGEPEKNGRDEDMVMCQNKQNPIGYGDWLMPPEFFCADGERRDENGEDA